MAVSIDTGVLSTVNRFDEIKREDADATRDTEFNKDFFSPPVRKDCLDEETAALNLHTIAGYGDADWYSPAAANVNRPYLEMVAARRAKSDGHLELLENACMSRLASKRILLRERGQADSDWKFCQGSICNTVACTWPAVQQDGMYAPLVSDTAAAEYVTIFDPRKFEAMSIQPISPMHRAIAKSAPEDNPNGNVMLRSSPTFGTLKMVAKPVGKPDTLLIISALAAFWDLPLSFMRWLVIYLDFALTGTSMFAVLFCLLVGIIPSHRLTDELLIEILTTRCVEMEPDKDLEKVSELEYVLDNFDKEERKTLEKEIKAAKEDKTAYKTFFRDVQAFKALM